MKGIVYATLWLLTACLLLVPVAKPATASAPAKKAAAVSVPDAEIERDLRQRLGRSKLSANKFEVKVQGGVAYISGNTNVVQHKGIATRMAKAAGAREVKNKIQVSEAARNKALATMNKNRKAAVVH